MKFGEFSVSLVSWSVIEKGSIVPAAVLEKDYLIKHVCKAEKTVSFSPVKLRPAFFIQTSNGSIKVWHFILYRNASQAIVTPRSEMAKPRLFSLTLAQLAKQLQTSY